MAYSDRDRKKEDNKPGWAKSNGWRGAPKVDNSLSPEEQNAYGVKVPQGHFYSYPDKAGDWRIDRKTVLGEGIKEVLPSVVTMPYAYQNEAHEHVNFLNKQMLTHGEVKKWSMYSNG